jgi:hypothetical protein
MTKFIVTAAHIVKRKKPVLLSMNLMRRASCPAPFDEKGEGYFG